MDTIKVKRSNVVLDISIEDKEKFMDSGYSVISEGGEVLEASLPVDKATLQCELLKARDKISELETKLKNSKAENLKLRKITDRQKEDKK